MEDFHPEPGETIMDRSRCSAFHETGPDAWLVENRIDELIITGVLTNSCCETFLPVSRGVTGPCFVKSAWALASQTP
jgi:isochorismate hydrolase